MNIRNKIDEFFFLRNKSEIRSADRYGIESGYGYGSGAGDGDGGGTINGYGYGIGHGNGSGDGCGEGEGDGYGYGYGSGGGSGCGSGGGDRYGDGDGYGDGSGSENGGVKSLNNNPVVIIDNIKTIVYSIKNNILKGAIINNDLTLQECYIVKHENLFSHGKTIKEAKKSVEDKALLKLPIKDRINLFIKQFNLTDKYLVELFYDWHFKLTGSCELGRISFMKNKNLDFKDKITTKRFIEITINEYQGNIIKQLKEKYNGR